MFRFLLFLTSLLAFLSVHGQDFRTIDLPVQDICYSQANDRLYAVIGGTRADGNAILILNPSTGAIEQRIEIGSEPSLIRVTDNGRYLYVMLYGAPYLQRYDLMNGVIDPSVTTESIFFQNGTNIYFPFYLNDLVPLPGSGTSVAVSHLGSGTPAFQGLSIFDQLSARPNQIPSSVTGGDRIFVSDDGQTLWGLGHDYEPNALHAYQISSGGLVSQANYPNIITGSIKHVSHQNGRIYLQNGQILDITSNGTPTVLTTLDVGQNVSSVVHAPMVPALDSNDIYMVTDYDPNYQGYQLKVYDKTSFGLRKSHIIPNFRNTDLPIKLISLGKGRVAMIATHQNSDQLVLFNDAPCQPLDLNLMINTTPSVNGCVGDTIELIPTPGYGQYFWSNGTQAPTLRVTATAQMTDSFSYRVLAPNGCLSKPSSSVLVRMEPVPGFFDVYLSGSRNIICPTEIASFVADPNVPNISFFTCSNGDTAQLNQYFNVNQGGIYYITAVGPTGCKSSPRAVEIFEAQPGGNMPPAINADGPLTFCSNIPTTLSTPLGAYGYEWSNGNTTHSMIPPWTGDYSVRILYENGCKSPWSDTVAIVRNASPSGLSIAESFLDLQVTFPSQIGDSLQWSLNGFVLQDVNSTYYTPTQNGFYTIQNFEEGCVSIISQPYVYPQPVQVKINTFTGSPNFYQLTAVASPINGYNYQWSNGSTNAFIEVYEANTYCVTVTRISDGITATTCIELLANDRFIANIRGADGNLFIPNIPVVIYDENSTSSIPVETSITNLNGVALFENVPAGNYKIRAIPDNNSPQSAQLMPTYWINGVSWLDAASFNLSGIRLEDTPPPQILLQMIPLVMLSGNGVINGVLTDGLLAFGGNGTEGIPLVGVSVFLYDASGNVVAYAITDVNGVYSFINLPPGIYTIVVNLYGVPPISRQVEVTLGAVVNNMNFTLINGAFVVKTLDLSAINALLWPNPTADKVQIEIHHDATITLYNTIGQKMQQLDHKEDQITTLSLAHHPDGTYFLQINDKDGKAALVSIVKQGN